MSVAMSTHTAQLKQIEEIAEGTVAFHLEKPSGFEFTAGQSIDLTLVNPRESDSEGNSRAFSIASATYEGEILVATRMRDLFTGWQGGRIGIQKRTVCPGREDLAGDPAQ